MNSLKKRMVQHINTVIEHFIINENPFSIDGETCKYNGPNGEHCAFAVVVPEHLRDTLIEFEDCTTLIRNSMDLIEAVCETDDGARLKDDFFWSLQRCHDVAAQVSIANTVRRDILARKLDDLKENVMRGMYG